VLYLLKVFTLFFSSDTIDVFSINYLKCLVIIFDFATLVIVVYLLKKNNKNLLLCIVFLLNPAFWYNTVIWGQVDTIHTFFVLCSLLFVLDKKPFPALIFILLAVNTKLQAVIFLPLILLMVFPAMKKEKTKALYSVLALAGLQLLIFLPFIISGSFIHTIHSLIKSSVDFYPTASRNAFNLWYLVFADPLNTSDQVTFLLPIKLWGIILFVLFFVAVVFLYLKAENNKPSSENIFLVFALISLGFFFFNTQMHERYVHPVILFSGLYAIFSKRYLLFIISSFAYLLNLEAVMHMFSYFDDEFFGVVVNYKTWIIFNPTYISLLFLSAIVIGIIDLQKN